MQPAVSVARPVLPQGLSDGSMTFDTSSWPVFVLVVNKRTTNQTFQEYLGVLRTLLERREPQAHVLDIPVGNSMPREQMEMQTAFLKKHDELARTYLLGTGLVFHSMIHRFGMAAMLALMPRTQQAMAYEVFGDRGEAISWGRTLLAKAADRASR